jgi:hypothetical protein
VKIKFVPGKVFYRLTLLAERKIGRYYFYRCRCKCGTIKDINANNVRSGYVRSCGCLASELSSKRRTTHGYSRSKEHKAVYDAWLNMIFRCTKPGHKHYKYYGGRGILVCQAWLESVDRFVKDVGKRPSAKHSLDRIDNNGNYEPGNVRWATKLQQASNTRKNRYLTFSGETRTVSQWSRLKGIHKNTLTKRLKSGWTTEDALTKPPDKNFANRKAKKMPTTNGNAAALGVEIVRKP